jgi:hypothetical protein
MGEITGKAIHENLSIFQSTAISHSQKSFGTIQVTRQLTDMT